MNQNDHSKYIGGMSVNMLRRVNNIYVPLFSFCFSTITLNFYFIFLDKCYFDFYFCIKFGALWLHGKM